MFILNKKFCISFMLLTGGSDTLDFVTMWYVGLSTTETKDGLKG